MACAGGSSSVFNSALKAPVVSICTSSIIYTGAFNALLKTLEEPPAHAIFILATTEPHKIPPTVKSLCTRNNCRRDFVWFSCSKDKYGVCWWFFKREQITDRLRFVAEEQQLDYDNEALEFIAKASEGGMRIIVGGILCGSVVARINMACAGGSSSVFNSALKA
jgi:DNA polymerase-3 subunit gamma/tau